VRLCYDATVPTTLDTPDDFIPQSSREAKGASIEMSGYGFPTFRCARPVTTDDVKALDDEE
jgi:hypothetical protein